MKARLIPGQRGQGIVELALVIPLLFLLLFSLFNVTLAVYQWHSLYRAARIGAQTAAMSPVKDQAVIRSLAQTAVLQDLQKGLYFLKGIPASNVVVTVPSDFKADPIRISINSSFKPLAPFFPALAMIGKAASFYANIGVAPVSIPLGISPEEQADLQEEQEERTKRKEELTHILQDLKSEKPSLFGGDTVQQEKYLQELIKEFESLPDPAEQSMLEEFKRDVNAGFDQLSQKADTRIEQEQQRALEQTKKNNAYQRGLAEGKLAVQEELGRGTPLQEINPTSEIPADLIPESSAVKSNYSRGFNDGVLSEKRFTRAGDGSEG